MGLLPQVVQEQFVHQPARDPHDLASGRLAVVAVRRADDADAAMLHALHHRFLLGQVARDAVQALHQQDIEAFG
nr:hypothetical protein [Xenophilus sp. Marseille-Q4582]